VAPRASLALGQPLATAAVSTGGAVRQPATAVRAATRLSVLARKLQNDDQFRISMYIDPKRKPLVLGSSVACKIL
jgi:hypothetical protein